MNRHFVFGTAGHIDHGKTAFIENLTGIHTDRLDIEKERGITIENGYAHLTLSSGATVGFIDVPGHEKLIKTMLAGAMGLDGIILIVAADEGIKPQTLEHLSIINHLEIKNGFVLITKSDLTDAVTLQNLKEEIITLVTKTIFDTMPILTYSIYDPQSKPTVFSAIEKIINADYPLPKHYSSRLHVDRVFTKKGYGTIVTGTLIEGEIKEGESIILYPGEKLCRVKGIHVYGKKTTTVFYGQRAALNLSVPLESIKKGDVLSSQHNFQSTMIIDIVLDTDTEVLHWQRLKLYHGTREILCRIALPDKKTVNPHERIIAQLRLETPIFCKSKDKIILRNYSPSKTIGGGFVLNVQGHKKKKTTELQESTVDHNEVLNVLKNKHLVFQYDQNIFASTSLSIDQAQNIINLLVNQKKITMLDEHNMILTQFYEEIERVTLNEVLLFHKSYPLRIGLPRETLRSKIIKHMHGKDLSTKEFSLIYTQLLSRLELDERKGCLVSCTYQTLYSKQEALLKEQILKNVNNHPQHLVSFSELEKRSTNKILIKEMLNHLINYEFLVKINDEYVMDIKAYLFCKEQLIQYLSKCDFIEVATYRDLLGYSRKSTVTLLEHFDKIQLTQRIDNKRIINKS